MRLSGPTPQAIRSVFAHIKQERLLSSDNVEKAGRHSLNVGKLGDVICLGGRFYDGGLGWNDRQNVLMYSSREGRWSRLRINVAQNAVFFPLFPVKGPRAANFKVHLDTVLHSGIPAMIITATTYPLFSHCCIFLHITEIEWGKRSLGLNPR